MAALLLAACLAPGVGDRRVLTLMGGGSEVDAAAVRFAAAAGGGDVLILRARGSLTSLPRYFTRELNPDPAPRRAATLRLDPAGPVDEPAASAAVDAAAAVWLAGGDQWDYLGRWPAGVRARLGGLVRRGASVGGTGAGAMSLGEATFDARRGGVTSAEALADPRGPRVSVSRPACAQPELARTLVDTHFTARDREGRLLAFLARAAGDDPRAGGTPGAWTGLGLDERAALTIAGGRFRVDAAAGRFAWVYRLPAGAVPPGGPPAGPLSLAGVRRARLADGAAGAWPPDPAAHAWAPVAVTGGVVRADGVKEAGNAVVAPRRGPNFPE